MNIYDRIINILLEARIEDFLDRLDEKSHMKKKLIGKQAELDKNKSGDLDSEDFKMLRASKRTDEASPMSRGERADKVSSKQVGAQPERDKQLDKGDPAKQALNRLDKSKSKKKPHRVFTGRRMKTASHLTTPTSKLKRAVQTVRKHG